MKILVALLFLLPSVALAQMLPDVPAGTTDSEFVCKAKQSPMCATCLSADSIELFKVSGTAPFEPVCVNTVGESPVLLGFTIPFSNDDQNPQFRARSYSNANCAGTRSFDTENSCVVTYTIIAPVLIGPASGGGVIP